MKIRNNHENIHFFKNNYSQKLITVKFFEEASSQKQILITSFKVFTFVASEIFNRGGVHFTS